MSSHDCTVVDAALRNPVILEQIFKYDCLSGKDLRLVAHLWNQVAISHPNQKLILNFVQFGPHTNFVAHPISFGEIDPKLARNIRPRISFSTVQPDTESILQSEFSTFVHHFNEIIQFMDIKIFTPSSVQLLTNLLENYCPHLKTLKISTETVPKTEWEFQQKIENFPLKIKLISIHVFTATTGALPQLTQLLINSAPNLRHLTFPWENYPDLSTSHNLVSLTMTLDAISTSNINSSSFNLKNLAKILQQVAHHLEFLRLGDSDSDVKSTHGFYNHLRMHYLRFKIPQITRLKHFRNEMIDIFNCGVGLEDLCTTRMPALSHLSIGKLYKTSFCLEDALENITGRVNLFAGVKSLTLTEFHNPTFLYGLKIPFPNLEKLEIDTYYMNDHENKKSALKLGPTLKACLSLELKHLDLGFPLYPDNIMDFIKSFLDCEGLYKSLEMLEITTQSVNEIPHNFSREEMQLFKKTLKAIGGIEKVYIANIYFAEDTLQEIMDFIAKKSMHVYFPRTDVDDTGNANWMKIRLDGLRYGIRRFK